MPSIVRSPRSVQSVVAIIVAEEPRLDVAVAFWGEGADVHIHPEISKPIRMIVNLRSGGTNPWMIKGLLRKARKNPHIEIQQCDRLHAKLIVGEANLVVGSANLSRNGLGLEGQELAHWLEAAIQTLAICIRNVDGASYQVACDGLEIYVPKSDNSYIAIGVVVSRDASLVPIIVKHYSNPEAFIVATDAIAKNVLDGNPISVTGSVQSHKDHREIRIEFPQYTIYGKTNPGAQEGFNKFCEVYDGVVWLILECGQSLAQWQVPLTGLVLKR